MDFYDSFKVVKVTDKLLRYLAIIKASGELLR